MSWKNRRDSKCTPWSLTWRSNHNGIYHQQYDHMVYIWWITYVTHYVIYYSNDGWCQLSGPKLAWGSIKLSEVDSESDDSGEHLAPSSAWMFGDGHIWVLCGWNGKNSGCLRHLTPKNIENQTAIVSVVLGLFCHADAENLQYLLKCWYVGRRAGWRLMRFMRRRPNPMGIVFITCLHQNNTEAWWGM